MRVVQVVDGVDVIHLSVVRIPVDGAINLQLQAWLSLQVGRQARFAFLARRGDEQQGQIVNRVSDVSQKYFCKYQSKRRPLHVGVGLLKYFRDYQPLGSPSMIPCRVRRFGEIALKRHNLAERVL